MNNVLNVPGHIFNCDKSGFPVDHSYPGPGGAKRTHTKSFDRKRLNPDWTLGEVHGTRYGLNESGWIDSSLLMAGTGSPLKFVCTDCSPYCPPVGCMFQESSYFNPADTASSRRHGHYLLLATSYYSIDTATRSGMLEYSNEIHTNPSAIIGLRHTNHPCTPRSWAFYGEILLLG